MDEADQQCDRIALMHRGRIRAEGTPTELKAMVGDDATLDDVFRATTGDDLGTNSGERMRDVRSARRTARRLS
jgi:ABC-2 type transport system ATP-binding protein